MYDFYTAYNQPSHLLTSSKNKIIEYINYTYIQRRNVSTGISLYDINA